MNDKALLVRKVKEYKRNNNISFTESNRNSEMSKMSKFTKKTNN
jgi:hypothetical protein